jgi:integral membrane sensor domain MASE1
MGDEQQATAFSAGGEQGAARFAPAALLALAYTIAAIAGLGLARPPASVAGIWLADAIALSFMLRRDQSDWLPLLAGAAVGCAAAHIAAGVATVAAAGFTLAHLVAIAVAALVVRRWLGRHIDVGAGLATYVRLQVIAAAVAPAAGALLGAVTAQFALGLDGWSIGWSWWAASAAGAIFVLPVTLWATPETLRLTFGRDHIRGVLGLALVSAATMNLAVAFTRYPYVVFSLPLAIAALRTNPFATALITATGVVSVSSAASSRESFRSISLRLIPRSQYSGR